MLCWTKQFNIFLFLDSNNYVDKYSRYECLLATGVKDVVFENSIDIEELNQHYQKHKDWLFGHISYDYKNKLEPKLTSANNNPIDFQDIYFFCPETVCYVDKGKEYLYIESIHNPEEIYQEILLSEHITTPMPELDFTLKVQKEEYLETIDRLRQHIKDGDCYEINFCNEGYVKNATVDTLSVFKQLSAIAAAPFAAYYRNSNNFMMCGSPERYLYKQGKTVLSQPIKGTIKRGQTNAADHELREQLESSIKDRAENVMITDLVRNDLAKSCETGSVNVDELFGIYSFPQVHQMISTISGNLPDADNIADPIKNSFPMGSMTGAPKVKVMELIEQYEHTKRGLFSGTVGYVTPDGDFDFNVIIRSLFYNEDLGYLNYQTGGAITYDSDPLSEWNEMRLKAWALERIFKQGV